MSNIADKIRKLIAKADSTTHEEEAETFLHKAHELMRQHGLNLLDLGRLGSDDPVGHSEDADADLKNNTSARWKYDLAGVLGKFYGCTVVGERRGTFNHWVIFGRESARTTFMLMYPFVYRQVMKLAREAYRAGKYPSAKHAQRAIGRALAVRVSRMVREQPEPTETGVNALVPVDIIQAAIDDHYGPDGLTIGKPRKLRFDINAEEAAKKVSINVQATGRGAAGYLT